MAITKKIVMFCTCDMCKKTVQNEKEVYQVKLPVRFTTEQTEGRAVEPYIVLQNFDLCYKCLEKATTITAEGAQGYNKYWFN